MTDKEVKFISLLRSLDEKKLDRFVQILKMIAEEDLDDKTSPKE